VSYESKLKRLQRYFVHALCPAANKNLSIFVFPTHWFCLMKCSHFVLILLKCKHFLPIYLPNAKNFYSTNYKKIRRKTKEYARIMFLIKKKRMNLAAAWTPKRLCESLAIREEFYKCVLPISNGSLLWHSLYSSSHPLSLRSHTHTHQVFRLWNIQKK